MRSIRHLMLSVLLGVVVSTAAVLGVAGAAAAHDAAESSTPAQGTVVASVPDMVSVTFNNKPLGIGPAFSVKDASGTEWAEGPVEIVDNVASQRVRAGGPAGEYVVSWRVVSSDSHPIEGTFSFTATAGSAPSAGSGTEGTTTAPAAPGMGTAQPGTTAAPDNAVSAAPPFQWSLVIFAVVAVGLLIALGVLARRRLSAGDRDADDTGSNDTGK